MLSTQLCQLCVAVPISYITPTSTMSAVSTQGLVLSLLGLTSLAGAGIAVGSGVSMVRSSSLPACHTTGHLQFGDQCFHSGTDVPADG